MNAVIEIVSVDAGNVAKEGYFCRKTKAKTVGNQRKLSWIQQRFAEGMRLHIVHEAGRSVGFIEYIPGEYAWRAVVAPDYLVIHCLWVVGRAKGYGSRLLELCLEEARALDLGGVAMVTSKGSWLAGSDILLKHGFRLVDEAAPSFELLVKAFDGAPPPRFPTNWAERQARYGPGLTVVRTDQCPYIQDATEDIIEVAEELGIGARVVELESARQVQEESPSAYGAFGVVHDGALLSYRYLTRKELLAALSEAHS